MKKPSFIKVQKLTQAGSRVFHSKNLRRTAALAVALSIFVTSAEFQNVFAEAEKEYMNAEEGVLTEVAAGQMMSDAGSADKDETVYVITDANGKVENTIVSDWLKNTSGESTISDASDLSDITNVKGDETFTTGSDGNITWNADGSDIFYQGNTTSEAPVSVNLSYYLDGKQVTPEEIAGKSGKVKIRLDYVNNTNEKVMIGDDEETIAVPFTVVSALLLDSDVFTNVEVTNGKIVSDGNRNIVVGVAMPGLKDSIDPDGKLAEKDVELNIPEYVEIEADANEFKLDMTISVAMSDVLSDFDYSKSIDLSEIEDSMEELDDASDKLVNGTGSLSDGTGQLKGGATQLRDGVAQLASGIGQYTDGVARLASGLSELKGGSAQLASGAVQVSNGVNQAVETLNGMSQKLQNEQAAQEANKQALAGKVDADKAAVTSEMTAYATQVAGAAATAAAQTAANAAVTGALNSVANDLGGLAGASEGITTVGNNIGAAAGTIAGNAAVTMDVDGTYHLSQANIDAINGAVSTINGNLSALSSSVPSVNADALKANAVGAATAAVAGAQGEIAAAAGAAVQGVSSEGVQGAIGTLATDAGQLGGATGAVTVLSTINSQMDLSQLAQLQQGAAQLAAGAQTLDAGVATAQGGANTLASNSGALTSGSSRLLEGSNTLLTGVNALDDGASELHDGMVKFDEEGIEKLTGSLEGNASKALDRIEAVIDAGNNYQSFTKLADGKEGKVKFVIRTGAVK